MYLRVGPGIFTRLSKNPLYRILTEASVKASWGVSPSSPTYYLDHPHQNIPPYILFILRTSLRKIMLISRQKNIDFN